MTPPEHPEEVRDENNLPENDKNPGADATRRRFTAALGGSAIILTLAGKPVWANQCTVSGMMSGNLSAPKGTPCQGCTPGYWGACQHLDSWGPTAFKPTDKFNDVFGVSEYVDCSGKAYTLLDVLNLNGNSTKTCPGNQPAGSSNRYCDQKKSGSYPGTFGGDPISPNLGFHAVASLLNAAYPNLNFGYTSGQIIQMFQGNYQTKPAALKDTFAMLNQRQCPLN